MDWFIDETDMMTKMIDFSDRRWFRESYEDHGGAFFAKLPIEDWSEITEETGYDPLEEEYSRPKPEQVGWCFFYDVDGWNFESADDLITNMEREIANKQQLIQDLRRMQENVKYKASDGTEFNTQLELEKYEKKMSEYAGALSDVKAKLDLSEEELQVLQDFLEAIGLKENGYFSEYSFKDLKKEMLSDAYLCLYGYGQYPYPFESFSSLDEIIEVMKKDSWTRNKVIYDVKGQKQIKINKKEIIDYEYEIS